MGVNTFTHESTTTIAPTRLFKGLVLDFDSLVPKLLSHDVKSIEIVEGDGGAGSIKQMNFVEGLFYVYDLSLNQFFSIRCSIYITKSNLIYY